MNSPIRFGIAQYDENFPELSNDVAKHISLVEYRINTPDDAIRLDDPTTLQCIVHAPDVEDENFLEIVKIASKCARVIAVNTHPRPTDNEWLCSGCCRLRISITSSGKCDFCGELNPDCWKDSFTFEQACEKLNHASSILRKNNKILLIENTYESPELIQKLLDKLPMVGFTLDTGHTVLYSQGPEKYLQKSSSRLAHMHLHDNPGGDSEKFHDLHLSPGDGVIDWDSFAATLASIGYTGTAVFECVPNQDWLNTWIHTLNISYKSSDQPKIF